MFKIIKDFLMAFSIICIITSVGFGFGFLFGKILNYALSFFPENFQLPIVFGTLIALIISLAISLINLKKRNE